MIIVKCEDNGKTTAFENQEYFENFNWVNFSMGDVIWMEDYEGPDWKGIICGILIKFDDNYNPIINIMPEHKGRLLASNNIENINELKFSKAVFLS